MEAAAAAQLRRLRRLVAVVADALAKLRTSSASPWARPDDALADTVHDGGVGLGEHRRPIELDGGVVVPGP